jgi:hypothetical protein
MQRLDLRKVHLRGDNTGMSKGWDLGLCAKAESNTPSEILCGMLADDGLDL